MGALTDEVVLITGGASGLGRAIVDRFLEEGAIVAVLDRRPEQLADLAAANPDRLIVAAGDVRDIADNQRAVATCVDRFEKLEEAAPAPVITAALFARFRSRRDKTFGEKMLSATRFGFGGHIEGAKPIDPEPKPEPAAPPPQRHAAEVALQVFTPRPPAGGRG